MTNEQLNRLTEKVKEEFKTAFGYDLADEDITECEDGIEIDYREYDLNLFVKYHHCPLVESCRLEDDGRCEYLKIYGFIKYDEFFTE